MISFTMSIDERKIFNEVRDFLLEDEIEIKDYDYRMFREDLPKDVQRLIFAKIGAMMIDYAGSEDF